MKNQCVCKGTFIMSHSGMIAKRILKDDYVNNGIRISNEEYAGPTPTQLRATSHEPNLYLPWRVKRNWEGRASSDQRGMAPAECWNWGDGDSKSTIESGPSLVGSLGSSCRCKRRLSCIGCTAHWSAQYKIFFSSPYTFSFHVSPSPKPEFQSQNLAGLAFSRLNSGTETPAIGQAVVQGRLSLNVRLRALLGAGEGGVV